MSTTTGDTTVGVIGLGAMGRPMAENLITAGFDVRVHGRRPEVLEQLTERGAQVASTPAELGAQVSILLLVLPDSPDTEAVLFGPEGAASTLAPGTLVIDCSTCAPAASVDIAARLTAQGHTYIDAPVSGGVRGAETGQLTIFVGGDEGDIGRARPVLEALGSQITRLGDVGAGQVGKACNQLLVAGTIELVAEALLLAERSGVDPGPVREALLGGFANSKILEVHGQRMLDQTYQPGFVNRLQAKDVRIIEAQAEALGMQLPAFRGAAEQVAEAAAHPEWSELDHSALHRVLTEGRRAPSDTGDRSIANAEENGDG